MGRTGGSFYLTKRQADDIRAAIRDRGLTQGGVAEDAGFTVQTLILYLRHEVPVSPKKAMALYRRLDYDSRLDFLKRSPSDEQGWQDSLDEGIGRLRTVYGTADDATREEILGELGALARRYKAV